jgi:hypothetical protein
MRKLLGVLFVSLPLTTIAHAEGSALEFPSATVTPLPHSLLEDAARRLPTVSFDFGDAGRTSAAIPHVVSHMPIISPKGEIDPNILKTPESSTDYKLIVKLPGVEPVK